MSKTKLNKKGKCPIKWIITFNKKRHHLATGIFINPLCRIILSLLIRVDLN